MAILMGRWDCSSCGKKGVMGDAYECSSCGAGRPDDVEFYLPSDAEEITDAKEIAAAEAGADVKCDYCQQFYAAVESQCPHCGGGGTEKHKQAGDVVSTKPYAPELVQAAKLNDKLDRAYLSKKPATVKKLEAATRASPPPRASRTRPGRAAGSVRSPS